MKKIKIVYFGSAYFSAILLEKILKDADLLKQIEVGLVVTQPDRPFGRERKLTPTPVKTLAEKYKIKTIDDINKPSSLSEFDLVLLYAYGGIISKKLLAQPKYGFWNIHPSLLPLYRGTSPIASPLINGDKITGVSLIKMDDKIDHGPIIDQESYTIEINDKRPDLEIKLTDMGFDLFKKAVLLGIDKISLKEQSHKEATYTKKLTKQDGFIKISDLKSQISNLNIRIYNLYKGLYPWPGIWTTVQPTRLTEAKRLKITDMNLSGGKLIIKKVQLEGKKEVDFETFNKAYRMF